MKNVHLIFGIFVLIVFLLTGQYMDKYYNHMVGVPDGIRLLYRTFFYEPGLRNLRTPLSHWGTYCIAAGVVLHVLTGIGQKKETTAS
ncbi:MAG: hypothetical protein DMF75_07580 [Acidobacteria bacterium]|nr:MAG: hypothetical protein DMF75_07580 [Acidobacteriota bacterium]